jgi:phosphoglycolate phosphatase
MNLLIFDLDGTLIDSKLDLVHAVNATRAHMGMGPLSEDLISSYVGNGAPILLRRALGPDASDEDVARALEFFLAYYREHMLDYTTLYPGVRETLDELLKEGHRLAVLTNKPVRFSQAIIDALGLQGHFFRVYGGNSFDEKKPDPVGIETIIRDAGKDREDALMIGDSSVDIQTARNAGVLSCGVTYGFQPETLIECPPDFLIGSMYELLEIVGAD